MIPKTIHYCWFGGNPLPELAIKCIESWKRYCPDYEILEWNETNFDVNYNGYVKEAYKAEKWAFVSDVARLYALVNHGGIYMDTDVEVLKPLDNFLHLEAFSGFEADDRIPTGIMACRKNHPFFSDLLDDYADEKFILPNGSYNLTTNVVRITERCVRAGLILDNTAQTVNGFTLFPKDFFCAKDLQTGALNVTNNTYTIHHFSGSWLPPEIKESVKLRKVFSRFLPRKFAWYVAQFFGETKVKGLRHSMGSLICWLKKRLNGDR